jgi:hypothetical protein
MLTVVALNGVFAAELLAPLDPPAGLELPLLLHAASAKASAVANSAAIRILFVEREVTTRRCIACSTSTT